MSQLFLIFALMFNPDAQFPNVLEHEMDNLIDWHIEEELDRLRECVAPYEPYDCYDALSATVDELLAYYDIRIKNVPTRRNCGGYFSMDDRTIYLKKYTNNRKRDEFYGTFAHEFGHVIQLELGLLRYYDKQGVLSAQFRCEQECDAIAGRICAEYFNMSFEPSYVSIDDAIWLKKYYGVHYKNDLILRKNSVKLRGL